jgi:hypothetical protein
LQKATFKIQSTADNCLYNVQWPYKLPEEHDPTLKSALIKTYVRADTSNSYRERGALSLVRVPASVLSLLLQVVLPCIKSPHDLMIPNPYLTSNFQIKQLYGTGWDITKRRDYIVMKEIDGIPSFNTEAAKFYTSPPRTKAMCKKFMEKEFYPAVAKAVEANVRDHAIQHEDLNGGNYLWNKENTEAYLIDWQVWKYRDKSEAAQAVSPLFLFLGIELYLRRD